MTDGSTARVPSGHAGTVALVVTCYERTYREVLKPGFFHAIEQQNEHDFEERVALINNVEDRGDAACRAEGLMRTGELSSYQFVEDLLPEALLGGSVPRRYLRKRPYLLDYGVVMPHAVSAEWILGWDAEAELVEGGDWITEAQALLESDPRVLTAGLNWTPGHAGLESEAVERAGDFVLNWGFSDQLFLIRRRDFLSVDWQRFTLASYVRHAPHPYTFEYRLETYQRATRRYRASKRAQSYRIVTTARSGVLARTDGARWELLRMRILHRLENRVLRKLPKRFGPRFVKAGR